MSKRMTKMEACHHLTMMRDEMAKEVERRKQMILDEGGNADRCHIMLWEKERIVACEARIRALEMAGAGLTR
jgi:hypothetical protein